MKHPNKRKGGILSQGNVTGPEDKRPNDREEAPTPTQSYVMCREQEGPGCGRVCTVTLVKDGKSVLDPGGHETTGKHLLSY